VDCHRLTLPPRLALPCASWRQMIDTGCQHNTKRPSQSHYLWLAPAHHRHLLCSQHLSLPRPFTPDLKLISFTNPFLNSHSQSSRTAFTCTELSEQWRLFVSVSSFFLATFALSWSLSFLVHVNLFFRIVSNIWRHLWPCKSVIQLRNTSTIFQPSSEIFQLPSSYSTNSIIKALK